MGSLGWRGVVSSLALALLLLGCGGESAAPRPAFAVWVSPETLKVAPDGTPFSADVAREDVRSENALWDAEAGAVRLVGARRETLAFQLQVEAGEEPLRDVAVAVSLGEGERAPLELSLCRVHYTEVERPSTSPGPSLGPGWYPDALIPFRLGGAPFPVEPRRTQAVWVDVAIAADARPGFHEATLVVEAADRPSIRLSLRVEVLDFALPEAPTGGVAARTALRSSSRALNALASVS